MNHFSKNYDEVLHFKIKAIIARERLRIKLQFILQKEEAHVGQLATQGKSIRLCFNNNVRNLTPWIFC